MVSGALVVPAAPVVPGALVSAQVRRDVELLTDRPPDGLGVLAVSQRLFHGPLTQPGQHVILGHARRICVAELGAHPLPELTEPHGSP
jgi:hypothetical protein